MNKNIESIEKEKEILNELKTIRSRIGWILFFIVIVVVFGATISVS